MRTQLKPLSKQVVVITGASSGIGLVTARKAAEQGAKLVLNARNAEALRELVEEIVATGGQAIAVAGDVANYDDVQRIANEAIRRFGGFDTWVNNAGVTIYGRVYEVSLADHRRLFETNYWGVVHGSLVALAHLRTRGGAIINVGSSLSDRAIPLQGTYCASKHALKGFTEALRMELEKERAPISVTLIKPSSIDTPYRQHAKDYMPVEPMNPPPVYAPETVANAILHCAEYPEADVFVGAAGRGMSLAGVNASRLTDWVMEALFFWLQKSNQPVPTPRADSLHAPSQDGAERGGYPGKVFESSLYTTATLHPATTAGLLGLGLAVGWLALNRSRR